MSQVVFNVDAKLVKKLEDGAKSLHLALDKPTIEKFTQYLSLFVKWNRAYNLSAIHDPEQILSKHLLDSLSVVTFLKGRTFIDVGTGAGLPGIPLALSCPDRQFFLLDSVGKKTRFLFDVKEKLALTNIKIINSRVEEFSLDSPVDAVISRAFAPLNEFTRRSDHLLDEGGRFLAMKGVLPQHELRELEKHYIVEACHSLQVPGLNAARSLVVIKKKN